MAGCPLLTVEQSPGAWGSRGGGGGGDGGSSGSEGGWSPAVTCRWESGEGRGAAGGAHFLCFSSLSLLLALLSVWLLGLLLRYILSMALRASVR